MLGLLLGPFSSWVAGSTVRDIADLKDRAAAINAVRQTVLTAAGGMAALVALLFTARTYYLSRSSQVADRYAKAAAMLASEKLDERVAGVYALERIMVESPADHDTVVEVLAAFVRTRASIRGQPQPPPDAFPRVEGPPVDIQAALTVLGRRPERPERYGIDLSFTDLRGADLRTARLDRAYLVGAWLHEASTVGASLRGAWLMASYPSWQRIRDFVDVYAEGLTAIQLANTRFDDYTRVSTTLRQQVEELRAWWDAGYPDDAIPSWLPTGSYDSTDSNGDDTP
jgi:hypothetical protein